MIQIEFSNIYRPSLFSTPHLSPILPHHTHQYHIHHFMIPTGGTGIRPVSGCHPQCRGRDSKRSGLVQLVQKVLDLSGTLCTCICLCGKTNTFFLPGLSTLGMKRNITSINTKNGNVHVTTMIDCLNHIAASLCLNWITMSAS